MVAYQRLGGRLGLGGVIAGWDRSVWGSADAVGKRESRLSGQVGSVRRRALLRIAQDRATSFDFVFFVGLPLGSVAGSSKRGFPAVLLSLCATVGGGQHR